MSAWRPVARCLRLSACDAGLETWAMQPRRRARSNARVQNRHRHWAPIGCVHQDEPGLSSDHSALCRSRRHRAGKRVQSPLAVLYLHSALARSITTVRPLPSMASCHRAACGEDRPRRHGARRRCRCRYPRCVAAEDLVFGLGCQRLESALFDHRFGNREALKSLDLPARGADHRRVGAPRM